jgi:hypothetical protein
VSTARQLASGIGDVPFNARKITSGHDMNDAQSHLGDARGNASNPAWSPDIQDRSPRGFAPPIGAKEDCTYDRANHRSRAVHRPPDRPIPLSDVRFLARVKELLLPRRARACGPTQVDGHRFTAKARCPSEPMCAALPVGFFGVKEEAVVEEAYLPHGLASKKESGPNGEASSRCETPESHCFEPGAQRRGKRPKRSLGLTVGAYQARGDGAVLRVVWVFEEGLELRNILSVEKSIRVQ